MAEGMERVTATLRIQALMRGYVARRRAALAKGRQLEAQRRRAYATSTDPGGKGAGHIANQPVGVDQLRLISGVQGDSSVDKVQNKQIIGSGNPSLNLGLDTGSFMDGQQQMNTNAGAAIRFAAFSTELTAYAFISRATRTQAAVRAILSNCCDLFIADSLLAAINETASSTGVRPARAAITYGLSTAPHGNIAPSAYVRENGPVIFTRIAHIRGKGAAEERRAAKKKAKLLANNNNTPKPTNQTPLSPSQASVEEAAA